jgi:hypothetical protein
MPQKEELWAEAVLHVGLVPQAQVLRGPKDHFAKVKAHLLEHLQVLKFLNMTPIQHDQQILRYLEALWGSQKVSGKWPGRTLLAKRGLPGHSSKSS